MPKLVFCDVEGTLLTASFPGMVFKTGRTLGLFTRWQLLQAGVLTATARLFPGKVRRSLQMMSIIRATAGMPVTDMDRILATAMPAVLAHLKPTMVARLQALQSQGYDLVLLSAGFHEGIQLLAEALGGRGEGTHMQIRNGRYRGQLDGPLCQGAGKAARAQRIMTACGADPAACYAFGDTSSDIPFLRCVGHPHAVDPDAQLAHSARAYGWPIVRTDQAPAVTPAEIATEPNQSAVLLTAADIESQAQTAFQQFITPRRTPPRERDREWLQRGTSWHLQNGLAVTAWGEGPTILLLHGWEGRGTSFTAFIPPLLAAGFRVVALDGPAHGASPGTTTDPLDFGLAVLAAGRELGPLAGIVAHSMGVASTAIAIARGLQVERVVLIAGPSSAADILTRFAQETHLPAPVAERFYALMAERTHTTAEALDVAQISRQFTVPALLFHDPADAEVPFHDAEATAAAWPGARLHVIEGRGHRRILLAPEVVQGTVEFLTEQRTPIEAFPSHEVR